MRKISVCGKGGSGKSAIVTLLASKVHERGYRVLVVDSDESNSGLFRMLGFDRAPTPILELVGGKRSVQQKMLSKFSSGESEPYMELLAQHEILIDNIPQEYMLEHNGIRLVSIGKILQSLEGCACPMGVISREFLKKLHLMEDEVAIVDMEAGVEHFGRGVETSIDDVLIVVEPSFESLALAEKVNNLAAGMGISNIWAVLNKVTSDELAVRLRDELAKRDIAVIGSIHYAPEIFEACLEGRSLSLSGGKVMDDITAIVGSLFSKV
jgi:CO dehydrogenase maturation factor